MDDNFLNRNVDVDPWDYDSEKYNKQGNQKRYYEPSKYNGYFNHRNNVGRYNRNGNRTEADNKLTLVSLVFSALSFLLLFILSFKKIVSLLNVFIITILFLAFIFAVIGIIIAIKVLRKKFSYKLFGAVISILLGVSSVVIFGIYMMSLFSELMSAIIYNMIF